MTAKVAFTFDDDASETAPLFVDSSNDFLSQGGKLWPLVSDVAASVRLHDNPRAVVVAAQNARVAIFFVPCRRAEPGDFECGSQLPPHQQQTAKAQAFARRRWGGDWRPEFAAQPGDTAVKEHGAASGSANADLDMLLEQRGVQSVILVGLIANTCVAGAARRAVALGYHVTLVRAATAAFNMDAMHAVHDVNGPALPRHRYDPQQ